MDIFFSILLSLLCGGILGAERTHAGKAAGLRTYMLVTMGATVFTLIAQNAAILHDDSTSVGRIVSQLILGIGFLGAGVVFHHKEYVHGLTTAAGLWIATAIGVAIGLELYLLAAIVTALSFIILALLPYMEEKIDSND